MAVYAKESPNALNMALQSLYRQSIAAEEIVLVKDGPLTHDLDDVILSFIPLLPLHIISLPINVGLAKALNIGLAAASHPWIMRFDSDDICDERRIESQISYIKNDNLDIFGSQIDEFDDNPLMSNTLRTVPCSHEEIVSYSKRRSPFNHMTVCYRKSFVEKVGGYPLIYLMEDYALWIKMISSGARTKNSPEILVHARVGNGMIARRGGLKYFRSEWSLQYFIYKLGFKSFLEMVIDGAMRSIIFLLPLMFKHYFYKNFLRSRPIKRHETH